MRFDVLTIFPGVFPGPLGVGVVGRALERGDLELHLHDLRDFTTGRHRQVDDIAFGGGPGMVLKPEPLVRALRRLRDEVPGTRAILLSPQGRTFDQAGGAGARRGARAAPGLRPLPGRRRARPGRDRRGAVGRRLRPERRGDRRHGGDRGGRRGWCRGWSAPPTR